MRNMCVLLLLLASPFACGSPDPTTTIPDHCRDYIKPAGVYTGQMTVTENGETVYEGDFSPYIYQSGGHGTSWAGLVGTAKESHVAFSYNSRFFQYAVTTTGTATLTDAQFDIVYESTDETLVYHYEITGLEPAESAKVAFGTQSLWEHSRELVAKR